MQDYKNIIKTKKLTKMYGSTPGIIDLDIQIKPGEKFGFLGPNGTGKSTTINLLLDLISPTSGEALVFGLNPANKGKDIKMRTGYLPGELGYYEAFKGRDYLNFFCELRGLNLGKNIRNLRERFYKVDLDRRIKTYSRGMKQLIGIMQAFMAQPDLYILDEPSANLDPLMKQQLYELIEEEAKKGKTFFLSSHIMSEVERICDNICIVKDNRVATQISIEELRKSLKKAIYISFNEAVAGKELMVEGVEQVEKLDERYKIVVTGELNSVLERISRYSINTFDYEKMHLEEFFFRHFDKKSPETPG